MLFFSFRESRTSRTVDGPLFQRTWRISSSDAVGFWRKSLHARNRTTKKFVESTKIFVHSAELLQPCCIAKSLTVLPGGVEARTGFLGFAAYSR